MLGGRLVRVTAAVVLAVVQDTLGPVPIVPQLVAHVDAVVVRAVANPSARLLQGLLRSLRRGAAAPRHTSGEESHQRRREEEDDEGLPGHGARCPPPGHEAS